MTTIWCWRLDQLEVRQWDTRRLTVVLAFGIIIGVLLVLVGAAIYAGIAG